MSDIVYAKGRYRNRQAPSNKGPVSLGNMMSLWGLPITMPFFCVKELD